jgi:NDP-sugar pyrophosphorylase family protein
MTATANPSVCILTAGTGRRSGPFADTINKCLLPYAGTAIISNIIEHFPLETPLVIALGYKGEQVRTYLTMMHPDRNFTFVEVDRYEGEGTGPGYSLSCCRGALSASFYFIAGDGVFKNIPATQDKNWLGISKPDGRDLSPYCNIGYEGDNKLVAGIYDKIQPPEKAQTGIFTGLMFIKDSEKFWESLEKSESTTNEKQIAQGFGSLINNGELYCEQVDWQDLGTFELYKEALHEPFDFGKTDEFIYLSDKRVVKFFANEKISAQRVEKAEHLPGVFPHITDTSG